MGITLTPRKHMRLYTVGSGLREQVLSRMRRKVNSGHHHSCLRSCALLVSLIFLALTFPASAQISPGPLSKPHSFLNGATNCTSCHKVGAQATLKCLECHTEIATRISAGRGLHSRLVSPGTASQSCSRCHSEHNGVDFPLVRWQPPISQFDHRATGWPLDGKHSALRCEQCHSAAHIAVADKPSIKIKDLNRTYLGLSKDCVACHKDQHEGRLGTSCQQCHTTTAWRGVSKFDHSKTKFALTGAHADVKCEKCHTPMADGKPRWTGLAYERCSVCHNDPHRGSFAATCQSCHNTTSWKSVAAATLAGKFDHATTKFPLLGKHADMRCDSCHVRGDFKKTIAFQKCSDCHHPDPHSGQFAKRPDGGECSACHAVEGFKPATFGLKEHASTGYPLIGKHADVACAKCHIPAGKATLFKIKFARCTDCHRDTHLGQFQAAPYLNRCETCHTVQGFRPSTFALSLHKSTRFPLLGAHLAIPCGECHKTASAGPLKGAAQFRFDDRTCTACHRDPHRGQFRERMARLQNGKAAGCEACHSVSSWKDLERFDHSSTKFVLTGAHRAVACADCHRPPKLETNLLNVDFKAAPKQCEECHTDPHAGQFANAVKATPCAGCHVTQKWKPSTFDHDTRTAFPLQGVHKNVRCNRCHTLAKTVDERTVTFYKPTPKECAACHGANVPTANPTPIRR